MTDSRYQVVRTVHGYAVHFLGIHIGTSQCRDTAATLASQHARVRQGVIDHYKQEASQCSS